MNNIVIKGRLTADPEMRKTGNGVPVANFTVAVDRMFNRDETDFFRCAAWRSTAEFVQQYFKKGQEILLTGEMHCDVWVDDDGEKHSSWTVQVANAEFCGSKPEPADTPKKKTYRK
jgi:single-strand DNA-binding protein